MSTPINDLTVTIVSSDRELLCDLSWTLSLFGYNVTSTCDYSEESPCRRQSKPGILLIDTRANDKANQALALSSSAGFSYRIAIETPEATESVLLQGADDVVRAPVNTGELLTRLRAGVRRLEFEARLSQCRRRDPAIGLFTRQAVAGLLEPSSSSRTPTTCVTFGIDFLPQICEQYGIHAVRHIKAILARCVEQSLAEGEFCGTLGENAVIAALHRDTEGGQRLADAVANAFAASDTLVREIRSLSTLSAVISEWDINVATDEQLDRCQSTLEQVHHFGGDYIALAADVQQRISSWRTDLDEGVPFEDVVAQDLMELFPAIINHEQAEAGYQSALPSLALKLPGVPLIDDDGTLAGGPLKCGTAQTLPANAKPQTIQYDQPLSDLFEAFNESDSDHMIVVDDHQCPIGYLTCEGLASLILDQMSASRYQSMDASCVTAASLVVPVVPVGSTASHIAGAV